MGGEIGLVWSWDPRGQEWIKERGPEDAASPFVAPVDDRAVQTYFLDTSNGRWTSTILGPRARQISFELGVAYRAPLTQQLAYGEMRPRSEPQREQRRVLRRVAGVAVLMVLWGGVFAGQFVFGYTLDTLRVP